MRFIKADNLIPGMVLGQQLFNQRGELLLQEDIILTERAIEQIARRGFNGVYIKDKLTNDLPVTPLISELTKSSAIAELKEIEKRLIGKNGEKTTEAFEKIVESIVNQIISSKELMVNVLDIKAFDEYTYYHCVNVAVISVVIGVAFEFDKDLLFSLANAAILHDIGKTLLETSILNKTKALTRAEFETIKKHPALGCDYLASSKFSLTPTIRTGILDHHERFDGQGYPDGRHGNNISLFGRIIAVADVYDALTSDRPYRSALSPAEAIEYIMSQMERQFDPVVVYHFVQRIAPYPVGTGVILSTGEKAIVCDLESGAQLRPKVKVYERNGVELKDPIIYDLSDMKHLNIVITGVC